jgi:hypothetical protein
VRTLILPYVRAMTPSGSEELERGRVIEPELRKAIADWARCSHRQVVKPDDARVRAEAERTKLALNSLLEAVVAALDGDFTVLDQAWIEPLRAGRVTRVIYCDDPQKELGSVYVFTEADQTPAVRSLNIQEAKAIAAEHGLTLEYR